MTLFFPNGVSQLGEGLVSIRRIEVSSIKCAMRFFQLFDKMIMILEFSIDGGKNNVIQINIIVS